MSLHYLDVIAMMTKAQDRMAEAQDIYVRHVDNRKPLDDEDCERLYFLVAEIDAISEKLQEVDRSQVEAWPDWALELKASKYKSLTLECEVLNSLERHYLEELAPHFTEVAK